MQRLMLFFVLTPALLPGCPAATDDSAPWQDPVTVDHLELTLSSATATADGSDPVHVSVRALDVAGRPVPAARLSRMFMVGGFADIDVPFVTVGDGTFTATVSSTAAVDYLVAAEDASGRRATARLSFFAGPPASVQLDVPEGRVVDGTLSTLATVTVWDAWGNPVDVDPDALAVTLDGEPVGPLSRDPDFARFTVPLVAERWGAYDVSASLGGSPAAAAWATARFPAGRLSNGSPDVHRPGVRAGELFELYLDLELPAGTKPVGGFDAVLSTGTPALDLVDWAPAPGCEVTVTQTAGTATRWSVSGWCDGVTGPFSPVRLDLDSTVEPGTTIPVLLEELNLYDVDGDGIAEDDSEPVPVPVRAKEDRTMHVCVWIAPGEATEDDVKADVEHANEVYEHNAEACHCPYFYAVSAQIETLTDEEWEDIAGEDGEVSIEESGDVDDANDGDTYDDDCYNVYYGPLDIPDALGATNTGSDAAFVDHVGEAAGPGDHRTFVHELGHLASGNIFDQGAPGAEAQGGNQAGNLYNYDDTGDEMTEAQCGKLPPDPQ